MVLAQVEVEDWVEFAYCSGNEEPEAFREIRHAARVIREYCRPCCVRMECLGRALDVPEQVGVRGGKTAPERLRMLFAIDGQTTVERALWGAR